MLHSTHYTITVLLLKLIRDTAIMAFFHELTSRINVLAVTREENDREFVIRILPDTQRVVLSCGYKSEVHHIQEFMTLIEYSSDDRLARRLYGDLHHMPTGLTFTLKVIPSNGIESEIVATIINETIPYIERAQSQDVMTYMPFHVHQDNGGAATAASSSASKARATDDGHTKN